MYSVLLRLWLLIRLWLPFTFPMILFVREGVHAAMISRPFL
jgi:hypothetical protein